MWGIFGSVLGGKAGNVAIILSFDPLGGEVKLAPMGTLRFRNHVFSIYPSGAWS
jgi:hypothetical protein